MPFSDHVFLSDLEKFDSFAFKFLSKREVVIQDCEYTGIVFSNRAKSIFLDELSQDESSDLYLNTKISAHYIKRSIDDYTKAQQTVFSVIYNKRVQNIILKAIESKCQILCHQSMRILFLLLLKRIQIILFL